MLLDRISSPDDLRCLTVQELEQLAGEIRQLIVSTVSTTGGHLASSLGAVDLIIALHRVFDARREPFFFDVGHQAYAHKILTGRRKAFAGLRGYGGCSGFPTPEESPFDPACAGHAGTAISLALGVAAAREQHGDHTKTVVIIGDGSIGNGIALEALNSTHTGGKNLLIILNDNQMSIAPNVGALARRFNRIIIGSRYNRLKRRLRNLLFHLPRHEKLHSLVRRLEDGLKSVLLPPGGIFQSLGVRYLGPVNGHSIGDLIRVLEQVRELDGPLLLHVITEKGRGCDFASRDPARYHGVGGFNPLSGELPAAINGMSASFGAALSHLAEAHPEVVAVSAAMVAGTGLSAFQRRFTDRCFDVGIAEEHAAAFCAGLAIAGKRPVLAVYATFMQRALDCLYHDVVLNGFPVIFALDRAGIVEDGPTHHGIYDLGFLRALPGLTIMAPRNGAELAMMLDFAYTLKHPTVLRYPKGPGAVSNRLPPPEPIRLGRAQILRDGRDLAIWAMGPEVDTALEVAAILAGRNWDCAVINARFVAPLDRETFKRYAALPRISIEDHCTTGGLGSALAEAAAGEPGGPALAFGWPADRVIPHGKPDDLRRAFGLDAAGIAAATLAWLPERP